jgi:hypothetical protein
MTLKSKLTTLSVVVAILVTSSLAAFASSDFEEARGEDMPQKFQEREFDYETVSTRHLEMTGEELTEEMFAQMQEARDLMRSGDKEGAKEIMDELGIKPPRMHGHKGHNAHKRMFRQNLTDEQKEVLKEAHELKLAGDIEGAKELIKAAGLEKPKHQERQERPERPERPGEFGMEK